ncbi:MAG: hypothetical protein K2N16_10595, partial [Muribaculaceae bacterium]|nr:hypothetical protein [Muribaculaceae bacterium]
MLANKNVICTGEDSEGTPVFTQDGNQRARGAWSYTILDGHKRPALQGEAVMTATQAREAASAGPVAVRSASSPCGYEVQGQFQPSDPAIATYYDDYGFCSDDAGLDFLGAGGARHSSAKGRATGMRQAGRLSVSYYDLLGNPVQQSGYNQYGYVDHVLTAYNFDQTPRAVERRHSRSESQSVTEAYAYSYDALGRETKVTHSINGGAARTISQSE